MEPGMRSRYGVRRSGPSISRRAENSREEASREQTGEPRPGGLLYRAHHARSILDASLLVTPARPLCTLVHRRGAIAMRRVGLQTLNLVTTSVRFPFAGCTCQRRPCHWLRGDVFDIRTRSTSGRGAGFDPRVDRGAQSRECGLSCACQGKRLGPLLR